MLSGRGLCDELITPPEESYRLWCVVVCVNVHINKDILNVFNFTMNVRILVKRKVQVCSKLFGILLFLILGLLL